MGRRRTLLVLPTGCGKTIVFSKLIEDCVRDGERVLVLAHRGELLDQAADKLAKTTGLGCAVEKAEESCIGSWFRVVVGSVQTLMREKRLGQFDPDFFNTIVVDEAHHCISDSYQKVLTHFDCAKVLGVTATPDRGDMRNLGAYFDSLAYEYTLPRAIKDGYLVPIKALTIPLQMDLTGVSVQAGDFKANDIGTALDPYLHQIAAEMADYPHVRLHGLMAIPPVSEKPGDNCRYFAEMRNLFVDISAKKYDNVSMDCLSMGMSGDYPDAIREGATLVRVGTAIFGARNYNKV